MAIENEDDGDGAVDNTTETNPDTATETPSPRVYKPDAMQRVIRFIRPRHDDLIKQGAINAEALYEEFMAEEGSTFDRNECPSVDAKQNRILCFDCCWG